MIFIRHLGQFAGISRVVFFMLRWLLLAFVLGLLALASLTAVKSPDWSPWRLGVLAGEYGHALAVLPILFGVLAWRARGEHAVWLAVVLGLCGAAFVLLLKPAYQAWRLGAGLPGELARQFPRTAPLGRAPFSALELFARNPSPVPAQTHLVPGGLPLDFYPAVRNDDRPAPCVVVVHGGGWDSGDRTQLAHFNRWLARRGYAVAAISYRLAPKFQWPVPRDDVLAAIAFLEARARDLRIDATRLVLLGRSAGGQIAQTVGYTAGNPAIRGVVALYAPSDLIFGYVNTHENDMLKSPALMRQFLGGTPDTARANYESASALFHVSRRSPPTLLLHGTLDSVAWHRHSERLAAKLAEHGVPHVYVALPWATHAFDFNLHGPGGQITTYAVERFLSAVTQ